MISPFCTATQNQPLSTSTSATTSRKKNTSTHTPVWHFTLTHTSTPPQKNNINNHNPQPPTKPNKYNSKNTSFNPPRFGGFQNPFRDGYFCGFFVQKVPSFQSSNSEAKSSARSDFTSGSKVTALRFTGKRGWWLRFGCVSKRSTKRLKQTYFEIKTTGKETVGNSLTVYHV